MSSFHVCLFDGHNVPDCYVKPVSDGGYFTWADDYTPCMNYTNCSALFEQRCVKIGGTWYLAGEKPENHLDSKIEIIKAVRSAFDMGLKEAKDLVEYVAKARGCECEHSFNFMTLNCCLTTMRVANQLGYVFYGDCFRDGTGARLEIHKFECYTPVFIPERLPKFKVGQHVTYDLGGFDSVDALVKAFYPSYNQYDIIFVDDMASDGYRIRTVCEGELTCVK